MQEVGRLKLVEFFLGVAFTAPLFFEPFLELVLVSSHGLHALDGFVEALNVDCSLLNFSEVIEQLRGST